MQSVSSRTTNPPDPMIARTSRRLSKSIGVSASAAGTQPPDTCEVSFEGFDELRIAVTAMMRRVRAATTSRKPLADLEQAVHEELLAVGAAVVQDGLNTISAAEVRRHDVTGPEGASRPWVDPGRTRTVVTVGNASATALSNAISSALLPPPG